MKKDSIRKLKQSKKDSERIYWYCFWLAVSLLMWSVIWDVVKWVLR